MAIGVKDPIITADLMEDLRNKINGLTKVIYLEDSGHFVPEHGEELATKALEYFESLKCLAK